MGQAASAANGSDGQSDQSDSSKKLTHGKRRKPRLNDIRQKLASSLRSGKDYDYGKHIRHFLSSLPVQDLRRFVNGYEALDALKSLSNICGLARKQHPDIAIDMELLFKKCYCSDLVLEYQGHHFPVHKGILSIRCRFFANLLSKCEGLTEPVKLGTDVLDMSKESFSSLLKYVYSGELRDVNVQSIIPQLDEKFGTLNELKYDMKNLLRSDLFADVILEFGDGSDMSLHPNIGSQCNSFITKSKYEVRCHSYVLSARSGYFRSLLRQKNSGSGTSNILKLRLDEHIIPRSYISIILDCFYYDHIDLSLLVKGKCNGGIAIDEPERLETVHEAAMALYEIGQFLDFPFLTQVCEELMVENFTAQSVVAILEWSSEPFGSQWVYRQALHYVLEEFQTLIKSTCFLAYLPRRAFYDAVSSDFLQASEETILWSVIKWGEWQVYRQQGSLSNTSLQSRSLKKKSIPDEALQSVLKDFVPLIRVQHIMPANSSVLHSALQRGILKSLAPCDVVASQALPSARRRTSGLKWQLGQLCPRLFPPYLLEAKKLLPDVSTAVRDELTCPVYEPMPDMLPDGCAASTLEMNSPAGDGLVFLDGFALDSKTIRAIMLRESKLKSDKLVVSVLEVFPDKARVMGEVHKRIMREFGLPDSLAASLFKSSPDLIEESSSSGSSASSRQGTLNKAFVMNDDVDVCACPSDTIVVAINETRIPDLAVQEDASTLVASNLESRSGFEESPFEEISLESAASADLSRELLDD